MADKKKEKAKMSPKKEKPRGWHVRPYLPTEGGLTEAEAKEVYAGLLHGGQLIPPNSDRTP